MSCKAMRSGLPHTGNALSKRPVGTSVKLTEIRIVRDIKRCGMIPSAYNKKNPKSIREAINQPRPRRHPPMKWLSCIAERKVYDQDVGR